jgi:hypothetical protein
MNPDRWAEVERVVRFRVLANPALGGLHHQNRLESTA